MLAATMMGEYEAHQCVDRIRQGVESIRQSLYELYQREGWRALGYPSWRACVTAEFGQSQRYLYRELDAARIVVNILPGEVWPMGQTSLPERVLRPLGRLTPDEQAEAWQEAIATAPGGKPTAAHVAAVVAAYVHDDEEPTDAEQYAWTRQQVIEAARDPTTAQRVEATIFSSASDEYYTPAQYIAATVDVLGAIDLDPASCAAAQATVKAARYYAKPEDGLALPWTGRVFLNPPYGTTAGESNQGVWARRLVAEYEARMVTGAILLVKAALGYEWFENLWYVWPVCFPRRRLSFTRANGDSDGQSKQGTALFYFGQDVETFIRVFRPFGRIILPEQ